MEFNVKDIRTKIMNPTASDSVESLNEDYCQPMMNASSSTALHKFDEFNSFSPRPSTYHILHRIAAAKPIPPPLMLNLFIKGLHVTFYIDDNEECNHRKTDLMSLYVDDILCAYNGCANKFDLDLTNVQIDNQLYKSGMYDFPVLLSAQEVCDRKRDVRSLPSPYNLDAFQRQHRNRHTAMITVHLVLYEPGSASSSSFSPAEIVCKIQPIRAYIEDKYINVLLDFILENLPANLVYHSEPVALRERCDRDGEVLVPKHILMQTIDIAEPFKLRHILIEPLKVLLSVHTCMR